MCYATLQHRSPNATQVKPRKGLISTTLNSLRDSWDLLSFRVERNESLLTLVETYTSDCAEGNLYPYYISGAIMGVGEGTYTVRVVYNDEYAGTTEQVHESTVTVMAYD